MNAKPTSPLSALAFNPSAPPEQRYIDGHPAHIAILGAGAFGTALAASAIAGGCQVTVISHENVKRPEYSDDPALSQCNFIYQNEINVDLTSFDFIVLAISSQAIRNAAEWIVSHQLKRASDNSRTLNIVCAAKGIERNTLLLPSQVLAETLPAGTQIGTLSGPTFARELRQHLPAALVFASCHAELRRTVKTTLHRAYFRIYDCEDELGIEVAGALKNVIAIVAGGCDGLELGNNARAAVVTRGFGEIVQIGCKMGANTLTFLGLGGLGDLFLTTSGDLSRNRQLGLQLAKGEKKEVILAKTGEVIEGIATTESAFQLAQKLGIDAPVIQAAYGVLYENLSVKEAVMSLVTRAHKGEFDWTRHIKATP
jgi:glycerol-3-phosphate dehydrogenase (NAD(P)+)